MKKLLSPLRVLFASSLVISFFINTAPVFADMSFEIERAPYESYRFNPSIDHFGNKIYRWDEMEEAEEEAATPEENASLEEMGEKVELDPMMRLKMRREQRINEKALEDWLSDTIKRRHMRLKERREQRLDRKKEQMNVLELINTFLKRSTEE